MADNFDLLWDLPAIIAAIVAAGVFGVCVWAMWFRRPLRRNASGMGALVAVTTALGSLLFTVSQLTAAFWVDDPFAMRIASRQGLWFVFAGVLGVSVWAVLRLKGAYR